MYLTDEEIEEKVAKLERKYGKLHSVAHDFKRRWETEDGLTVLTVDDTTGEVLFDISVQA